MSPEEFVTVLKKVVVDQSIRNAVNNLEDPPGRQPAEELIDLSDFYKNLPEDEKMKLKKTCMMVAEDTLFGLLCVIDGVRAIENGEDKGILKLFYEKGQYQLLLNDPEKDFLHDCL